MPDTNPFKKEHVDFFNTVPLPKENDVLFQSLFEEETVKKTKRNKHPTECNVKRRSYNACGICGSENIADQGVYHCENCEKEEEFLILGPSWWYNKDRNNMCDCVHIFKIGKRTHTSDCIKKYAVGKCLDCGAVKSFTCPNCKEKNDNCWQSVYGEKYCQSCGYRFKGYKI